MKGKPAAVKQSGKRKSQSSSMARPYPYKADLPLIGVLTCPIGRPPARLATLRRKAFRELIIISRQRDVVVYVFAPEGVDWQRNQVTGSTLIKVSGRHQWREFVFPLPDVVYNKVPNRYLEKSEPVQTVKTYLREQRKVPVFNPCYLNKWDSYNWLAKDPEIKPHLPETHQFSHRRFKEMLNRHGSVYVKPSASSLGKGIIRVEKVNDGFLCTRKVGKNYENRLYSQLDNIARSIEGLARSNRYLVQQTVNLAQYQGRNFDIRALVQKDGQGIWCLTGMAARVARPNAHLTHVPNGGQAISLQQVLSFLLKHNQSQIEAIMRELTHFAERVPASIEQYTGLHFGEFSLDIGLDRDLNIWLIEINSKPFRFDERNIRLLSHQRIVDYATYLASRKEEERGSL